VPVAADKVTATFEEGMLVVHLPKAEPAPANKILIK
jgi:HSP20 family molecular chaperone IbpA